jgi:hypothetical protein
MEQIKNILELTSVEKKPEHKRISYSQFSLWATCPNRWKLSYVDKHDFGMPSIHLVFGTSFHETLQYYIHTMYNSTIKAANELDLNTMLKEKMSEQCMKAIQENPGVEFTTKDEMIEFYSDGVAILDWIKKKRAAYFSNKGCKLVGIEMPLYTPASPKNENVMMVGFLDLVFQYEDGSYVILDIKTSTRGWNKYQKADKLKASQLVLYKEYFARQYNVDPEQIQIKYFIVKRKLIEDFAYPQRRVQEFIPASGKPTRNKLLSEIDNFITTSFKKDGSYNTEGTFPAISGQKGNNCRFCEYNTMEHLCPKEKRI